MAEKTKRSITIDAPAERVMEVIADFDAYPTWVSAAKTVEVVEHRPDGRAERVRFVLDAGIVKDTYVLRYKWASDNRAVSWELESGEIQKAQSGSYVLTETPDGTTVALKMLDGSGRGATARGRRRLERAGALG